MTPPLLRVAVVGATGTLGGELIDQLRERRFPIQELRPIATDESLGATVDWLGHDLPVEAERESLRGLDLVFLCTPPDVALEWIRKALQAEVPCIDFTGALAGREEVALRVADRVAGTESARAPLLAIASPITLALVRVFDALAAASPITRVSAVVCESASAAGRAGVEALQAETVALFNQEELPETGFEHPFAFDCLPAFGDIDERGASAGESRVGQELASLLPSGVASAITTLRIPTFAGTGIQLAVETAGPLAPDEAREQLEKLDGLSFWALDPAGPTTRDAVGEDDVLVGRIRRDPGAPHGLLLWLAFDPVRLAVADALRIAEVRFRAG